MPAVVGVHGIAQQLRGPEQMRAEWWPALSDGLTLAGASGVLTQDQFEAAFYGNLFRRKGKMSSTPPPFTAGDVDHDDEVDLLLLLWEEAARAEAAVPGPDASTMARTPLVVQRALNALSKSRFFADLSERMMIGVVKQVHLYFTDDEVREAAIASVEHVVGDDTRVIVGHSLGSVVAYEALARHPEWKVRTFVSVGSPLGIRNVVFDRLRPAPRDAKGAWPQVASWVNVADAGDVVALVKSLDGWFAGRIADRLVHNGAQAHAIGPYLSAPEVGSAVAAGIG